MAGAVKSKRLYRCRKGQSAWSAKIFTRIKICFTAHERRSSRTPLAHFAHFPLSSGGVYTCILLKERIGALKNESRCSGAEHSDVEGEETHQKS